MPKTQKKSHTTTRTDIFSVLKKEHRMVEKLFKQIEKADYDEKEVLYDTLNKELTAHAEAEEKSIYPALREVDQARENTLEALEEHALVKYLLRKLDGMNVTDETWDATCTVLKEMVLHHVEEEESVLFAKMRKYFNRDERADVLQLFEEAKGDVTAPRKQWVA